MSAVAVRSKKTSDQPATSDGRVALKTAEAAAFIGLEPATLKKWRAMGDGPSYVKAGSRVVYLVDDLIAWLRSHRIE